MSMLKSLEQWVKSQIRTEAPVDPSVFADPLALKTAWTPNRAGGASFGTHRLVAPDETKLAMRKTVGSYLFGGVFLLVGAGVCVAGVANAFWLMLVVGVLFAAAGLFVVWPSRLLFDASAQQFSGGKEPLPFSRIHALQIVREYVRNNKSAYWSYELNLVLTDGERVTVVDHGNLESIRADAQRIGELVRCKVWDATALPATRP